MAESQPHQGGAQPAGGSPLLLIVNRVKDVALNTFKERKPWAELVDRTAFSRPSNLAEAMTRLRKNAAYFKINYVIFILITTVICMVFNPTSLIVLACLALAWIYLFAIKQTPLVIGGRTFSDREKFVGMSITSVVVVFFLTSVGTVLFTALGIGVAVIAAHGSLRVPDDLFLDETEAVGGGGGFLSFIGAGNGALASNV